MSASHSRSFSFRGMSSRCSSSSFSDGDETFKSKGIDLAHAILSEIEDMLREYDSELSTVCFKSQSSIRDLADSPLSEEVKTSSSFEAIQGEGVHHWKRHQN